MENTPAMAYAPVLIMQSLTIIINMLPVTQRLYERMNATYSAEDIHIFGTLFITTAVYWALGLVFMFADLTERPKWLLKYKVQPWKRVGPKEYTKICAIVLRNQIFVNIPLSIIMGKYIAPLRGMRTGLPLPGVLETVGTWWFCLACTEVSPINPERCGVLLLTLHWPNTDRVLLCAPTFPLSQILRQGSQEAPCASLPAKGC